MFRGLLPSLSQAKAAPQMISVRTNMGAVAARLRQRILSVQDKDKMLRTVASNALAQVAHRIHVEGKDASGGQIGEYSPGYMAVRTGKFKSNSKVTRGKRKGETRATGVFTKGINKGEPRPNYNRTDDTKAVLSLTRKMENEFAVIADGTRYGLGFLSSDSVQKARWCEETYDKKIYALMTEEKQSAKDTAKRFISDAIHR